MVMTHSTIWLAAITISHPLRALRSLHVSLVPISPMQAVWKRGLSFLRVVTTPTDTSQSVRLEADLYENAALLACPLSGDYSDVLFLEVLVMY